jgi:SAM-dependent methyltransferase
MANRLTGLGSSVIVTDRSAPAARAVHRRNPNLFGIGAAPDALPFVPCTFGGVLLAQSVQILTSELVLDEFARVLAPGGRLAVLHTSRDDSVPWVRRLAAILQAYDPDAMTGGEEFYSVAAIAASAHFPVVEHHTFRLWVPVTRDGLLEMVGSAPTLAALDQPDADRLRAEVGALYDGSARQPEPLLLPYSVMCWRATVDHSELSRQLQPPEDGLRISL